MLRCFSHVFMQIAMVLGYISIYYLSDKDKGMKKRLIISCSSSNFKRTHPLRNTSTKLLTLSMLLSLIIRGSPWPIKRLVLQIPSPYTYSPASTELLSRAHLIFNLGSSSSSSVDLEHDQLC